MGDLVGNFTFIAAVQSAWILLMVCQPAQVSYIWETGIVREVSYIYETGIAQVSGYLSFTTEVFLEITFFIYFCHSIIIDGWHFQPSWQAKKWYKRLGSGSGNPIRRRD